MQRYPWLARLFILVLSVSITGLGIELGLQMLSTHHPKLAYLAADRTQPQQLEELVTFEQLRQAHHFLAQPGTVMNQFVTNSKGFVTPELSYDKPGNTYRVVLIADSQGVGVVPFRQNFTRRFEALLRPQLPAELRLEVINLSVVSIGIPTYERLLALEAARYQPDLVVVMLYLGNDFDPGYTETVNFRFSGNSSPKFGHQLRTVNLLRNLWTIQRSYLHQPNLLGQRNHYGLPLGNVIPEYTDQHDDTQPSYTPEAYRRLLQQKRGLFIHHHPLYLESRAILQPKLEQIHRHAQLMNTTLVFVLLPEEMQLDAEMLSWGVGNMQPGEQFVLDLPQQEMRALLPEDSLVLDLLPAFQQQQAGTKLYQPLDSHLNTVGHQVVARELLAFAWPLIGKQLGLALPE